MADGRIEIHDPFANRNDLSGPPSDADDLQNLLEFRLLMAYAKRRRRRWEEKKQLLVEEGSPDSTRAALLPAESREEATPAKTKKKKKWKRLPGILICIKPQTEKRRKGPEQNSIVQHDFRSGDLNESEEAEEMDEVASRLTEIADEIPFAPSEVEPDSPEHGEDANVEKLIGLLLRECGDNFDEEVTRELKDALRSTRLLWNYGFYQRLMKTLLVRMGLFNADPEAPGPQTSLKTQMAVACEVTSRLSATDAIPMNRLLGYGATYLQNHFSPWVKQQGGYEAAFIDDEDDPQ